jgi:hypothetical protein
MAKEKDDVTPEVTQAQSPQTTGTTRPGFSTQVTDAPDYDPDRNSNAGPVSKRVQEEQAAGRATLRDLGQAAVSAALSANPADRDPAHAAEVANAINAEHAEHDLREANKRFLPEGETDPGEVPSRGYVYEPLPGEEFTQGTAAYKTTDPRYEDPDSELGKRVEGLKQAREAEEARVKETVARANEGSGGNDRKPQINYTERVGQQRDQQRDPQRDQQRDPQQDRNKTKK